MSHCQTHQCKIHWLSGTTSGSTTALATICRHSNLSTWQPDDPIVRSPRHATLASTSSHHSRPSTTTVSTASSANHCAPVDAALMVAPFVLGTPSNGGENLSFRGISTLSGNDAFDDTYSCADAPVPMPQPSPSPASPVVQTLGKDDDEDMTEHQPMPPQPLLPARRPRASSIADPPAAEEALLRLCLVSLLLRHLLRLCLFRPLLMHPLKVLLSNGQEARQYDLPPQQPLQPLPHLQPPLHLPALPASSSSPAALPPSPTTSSPTEPEVKKQKQQDEDEDKDMDLFHPLEPHHLLLLQISKDLLHWI